VGHILGLGSQWAESGNVQYDEVTGEYAYVGANAINVWKNVWQCESAAPPIETDGGEGTAGLHWDESCMQNERMTGYVNPGGNPTSLLTIAALADLNYGVDYTKADPSYNGYSMDNTVSGCCNPPVLFQATDSDAASVNAGAPTPDEGSSPTGNTAAATSPAEPGVPPPTNAPITMKPTPAMTSYPTTGSPTVKPTAIAMNIVTGDECVVPETSSKSSKDAGSKSKRRRGLAAARHRILGSSKSSTSAKSCKKKKNLKWKKKDKAWKLGMKLLRDRKLPPGVPRVQAGVKYVGDMKVSLLVEDEGMLYEVEVLADGSITVS
jgi:hypothetical protein